LGGFLDSVGFVAGFAAAFSVFFSLLLLIGLLFLIGLHLFLCQVQQTFFLISLFFGSVFAQEFEQLSCSNFI